MTADARCALGPKLDISESQPNAYTPFSSAACSVAGESVFWISTSTPWPIIVIAASRSLAGSNQDDTQTARVEIFGFTDCAPRVKALMLRMTSGIGNDATTPSLFDLVILPASTPAR